MRVYMTFVNRKSSPASAELVCAWDEVSRDENPQGYERDLADSLSSLGDELLRHYTFTMLIPEEELLAVLNPYVPPFLAKATSPSGEKE